MSKGHWSISSTNPDMVIYKLDKIHMLYVSRTKSGIRLRVTDNSHKPKVLFVRSISNSQLGIDFPEKV